MSKIAKIMHKCRLCGDVFEQSEVSVARSGVEINGVLNGLSLITYPSLQKGPFSGSSIGIADFAGAHEFGEER